jgi:hypothetical protein
MQNFPKAGKKKVIVGTAKLFRSSLLGGRAGRGRGRVEDNKGCQIFLDTIYQSGEKYNQSTTR